MKKYAIEITAVVLTILWVIALGIEFFAVLGMVNTTWHIMALMLFVLVIVILMGMVLVTNTRRPYGIDPNVPGVHEPRDPFGMTTDDLWKEGMPERRSIKRRASDQPDVDTVNRLIVHFRDEDLERPAPEGTPAWALNLLGEHEDEQGEEV